MSVQCPESLSIDEFMKSATMFYIDSELEAKYTAFLDENVSQLQKKLLGIATQKGLEKYIREEKDALGNLIALLDISEEKFKRIITMLRIEKHHRPTGEWTLRKVREQMLANPDFMREICELLLHGSTIEKYKLLIPSHYLENFKIDASTLGRLANPDDIRRLLKKSIEGRYNNQLGDSYFKTVVTILKDYCDEKGLTYTIKKEVPKLKTTVSFAIFKGSTLCAVINIVYGITTSSTQTKYANLAEQIADKLRSFDEASRDQKKCLFINVVDGAGWVARQSDLSRLERCSDFLVNLKNLSIVKKIIDFYL